MPILSLGSINADFQLRVDRWPPDAGLVPGHDLLCTSGGKAANVAVFTRRLDTDARLFGCVSDDGLAEQALRGPRDAGVDLSGVRYTSGPTGLATILVTPAWTSAACATRPDPPDSPPSS